MNRAILDEEQLPWIRFFAKQRSKIALNGDEVDEDDGDEGDKQGNEDGIDDAACEAEVAAAGEEENEIGRVENNGENNRWSKLTD